MDKVALGRHRRGPSHFGRRLVRPRKDVQPWRRTARPISASPRTPSRAAARAVADPLGRRRAARARAGHRLGDQPRRPQRHRRPWRLLFALSRARGLVRRAQPAARGPDLTNTASGGRRSARIRNGASPAGSSRSIPGATSSREDFAPEIAEGIDIRPTIAVTKARLNLPEIVAGHGRRTGSTADGEILHATGDVAVTKVAIDPVWYLPGIAERFGVTETKLRRTLFEQTGGMYPELVTRPDLAGVPAADRRHHALHLRRRRGARRPAHARSPAACTTSATARTCSAPTSAPAGPISCTASRSACARRRAAASA